MDRIRSWLHVILALSANSPFWYGEDSGFSSFRYQAWSRWPTAGPTDIFGSPLAYDCRVRALLRAGAAIDAGMMYFDARLSEHCPTVEVRVSDVCLDAEHAAILAALTRALVETASHEWELLEPPRQSSTAQIRAWSWHAARYGLREDLADPRTGAQLPAGEAVGRLLDHVTPALRESGDLDPVTDVLGAILQQGSGVVAQRRAFAKREGLHDVVATALDLTHGHQPPGAPRVNGLPMIA